MTTRRTTILGAVVAAMVAAAATFISMPIRYVVDGMSMGPGLLPGDVVSTAWAAAWSTLFGPGPPHRFDRWVVALPDGSTGLKRVIGRPGETVSIADGDLAIDGPRVLKGPRLLAELGSVVADVASPNGSAWVRERGRTVLDDAAFAPGEVSRLMLPVQDGGFAVEVTVPRAAFDTGKRVWAFGIAGPLKVTWRIKAAGRFACVMGRLDGHAVAATWSLPEAPDAKPWRCLPADGPDAWDVSRPWPDASPDDETAPFLSFATFVGDSGSPMIARVVTWRDILYRPAADGVTEWRLGATDVFLLGDFPSGSRDSRHFGPLPIAAFRHRIP